MVWRQTLIFCTFLISLIKIQQVVCSGVFELRLKSFINENSKDSLGHCCSGERNGPCTGPCRTRFRVCLKHFQNQIDTNSGCTFGDIMTPVLGDNNVHLTDAPDIPGFKNPIRFPFDFSWPGWFSLIVEAWHDATSSNTSADDAGVSSKTSSGMNKGGRRLISQFPMQQRLEVTTRWTEQEHKSNNSRMVYEFRVTCDAHYYGSGCANLCRPRNDNFGHYTCSPSGEIVCLQGWKGDYCTKAFCLPGCNETHGSCNKPDECLCHSGWKGRFCDECERYPGCLHGTCNVPWECLCVEGWGGLFCNQDLNYCTNHKPCRNGGTCFNTGQGSYTCSCPPGYNGTDCDKKLSDCSHKPCLNGATCKIRPGVAQENGTSYQCECSKGWYGTHCEIAVQTCESRPCQHGAACMDTIHGYMCSCPPGYSGAVCQNHVNHCAPNPCSNNGNCSALPNNVGFKCHCPSGFSGNTCQTNIDDCHGNPCKHGGTCIDLVNNYRCQCVPGFVGDLCQTKVDNCKMTPCANGGICENLVNDFKCRCKPGFHGKDCSGYVDKCDNNICANGGTCYNRGSSFQCDCTSGFSGELCENVNVSYAVSTAIVGNISRHVLIANGETSIDKLIRVDWYLIVLVSVAVPTVVLVAALVLKCSKQKRERERKMADEEARMQNEQNSVHSSVTKHGDTHMIKNTWGQCVKNVDTENVDFCYPKQVYAAVPVDPNIAPEYALQRSRSQKQLNVDPPLQRHSVCNRFSSKDLDNIVRTSTPAPLDNRLSLSINISHCNLSDSSISKQQDKSVQNNTLNSSVLNGSSVYLVDEHFTQPTATLFATEV